jgi:hypothetical protein
VHCQSRVAVAVVRGQFGNPGRGTSAGESRYQRTGEGTADRMDSVHAILNCTQTVWTSDSVRL